MSLRDRIKRLEQQVRGNTVRVALVDGTHAHYDPVEGFQEIVCHALECLQADHDGEPRPPIPEILITMARASDRAAAIAPLYAVGPQTLLSAFDLAARVERGELVPICLTAGREYREVV